MQKSILLLCVLCFGFGSMDCYGTKDESQIEDGGQEGVRSVTVADVSWSNFLFYLFNDQRADAAIYSPHYGEDGVKDDDLEKQGEEVMKALDRFTIDSAVDVVNHLTGSVRVIGGGAYNLLYKFSEWYVDDMYGHNDPRVLARDDEAEE